jgi:hypothetical protein
MPDGTFDMLRVARCECAKVPPGVSAQALAEQRPLRQGDLRADLAAAVI